MDRDFNIHCFNELSGAISSPLCTIEHIDEVNSGYVNPRIRELTTKTFFRYYKLHIHRLCKAPQCNNGLCTLEPEDGEKKLGKVKPVVTDYTIEQLSEWENGDCDTCFCIFSSKEDADNMLWIDLVSNPEQYTGYDGQEMWRVVYDGLQYQPSILHRTVSGLHSSINMHLCYKYVSKHVENDNVQAESIVGPNVEEFVKRFHPESTDDRGPTWLKNLYFTYVLLLTAVREGESYWEDLDIHKDVKRLVVDLIEVSKTYGDINVNISEYSDLQNIAMVYLTNISGAFDYIGCERCRLWGKVQIVGTRTAYKILFNVAKSQAERGDLPLTRMEIVSLFNTLGRLSESLRFLTCFKTLILGRRV